MTMVVVFVVVVVIMTTITTTTSFWIRMHVCTAIEPGDMMWMRVVMMVMISCDFV